MAGLMLKEIRDSVRRRMQIDVPFDQTGLSADIGVAPNGQPDPNNAMLNMAINDAISIINSHVRVGKSANVSVSVNADTSERGTLDVDISAQLATGVSLSESANVKWFDGTNTIRLQPTGFYAQGRRGDKYAPFQQYAPGSPRQWSMDGNQVLISPPPSANGTLIIKVAEAMPPLVAETDTLSDDFPINFHNIVQFLAVVILSARAATDVEAQARMQSHQMMGAQGVGLIMQWKGGYSDDAIKSARETLLMNPFGLYANSGATAPQQAPQDQG